MASLRGPDAGPPADGLVGRSAALQALRRRLAAVAASTRPVLVLGETGTGKERVAAAIHRASPRARGPFVPVNCGTLADELLGAQLFGHTRGAFTGAVTAHGGLIREAQGGTLFLDEIGELTPRGQAALLRFLDSGEVRVLGGGRVPSDVRVLAATHRDLLAEHGRGAFRADLYYRLRRRVVRVPPLRARLEDLPLLVAHIVARMNAEEGLSIEGVTPEALARLAAHPWPGNVRELECVLEDAMLERRTGWVAPEDLAFDSPAPADTDAAPARPPMAVASRPAAPRPRPPGQTAALALELARTHGRVTRGDLVALGGVGREAARQTLSDLTRQGQLRRAGRGRGGHYLPA